MPAIGPLGGDVTMTALQSALDGLDARQQAIANNISNFQTPGYSAQVVSFEGALSAALASGANPAVTPTVSTSTDPAGTDGNNVSLDDQTVLAEQTELRYQTVVQALNDRYGLLRDAIDATGGGS